ncbi:hypothetical protein BHM03_00007821 [Ensete ventricosum]|nr:hypothetical protein BHM03_00007821 [Ensete ventricosum]
MVWGYRVVRQDVPLVANASVFSLPPQTRRGDEKAAAKKSLPCEVLLIRSVVPRFSRRKRLQQLSRRLTVRGRHRPRFFLFLLLLLPLPQPTSTRLILPGSGWRRLKSIAVVLY